ncbi:MAG TPA: Rrf2 family transcriptional regulator [Candidatus Limnocylindria bacterium]|nr:Rrf2 family transcriptional regulator [Candidatus Limnocylindria bacterium]
MQITRAGEYGVLGLLALSRRAPGDVVMLDVIAREEDIPTSFLGKIFQSLAKAGIVKSARGTGGGFALEKPASQITVLSVLEAIEGPIAFGRCLDETVGCENTSGCALCGLLAEAQDRVKEVFAKTSITQLAGRHLPKGLMKQARENSRGADCGTETAQVIPLTVEILPST